MSKLSSKREAFAKAFVECGVGADAYRKAYNVGKKTKDETIHSEASRILNDHKVAARVTQLQRIAQERHNVTVDTLTEELEQARDLALTEGIPSAAVSATLGKAKIHGLDGVKKVELTGKDGGAIEVSPSQELKDFLNVIAKRRGTAS